MNSFISDISSHEFPMSDRICGDSLRPSIMAVIQSLCPSFTVDKFMSQSELSYFRGKYISSVLVHELGDLTELEQTVLSSLADKTTITTQLNEPDTKLTIAQKVADRVAGFGGSWKFIIIFFSFMAVWIGLNVMFLRNKGFDPYPFILLNLLLSCIASIQAPVIMMSQNRQEEKDRDRVKKDYMINLKAELEIRVLHEKIDHLIMHQQQELLEIQKVQMDTMEDILQQIRKQV